MPTEIERRFLVNSEELKKYDHLIRKYGTSGDTFVTHIEQVYLSTAPGSVRVRHWRCQWADRPQGYALTIKGPGTISRQEITIQLDKEKALEIMAISTTRVAKIRTEYTIEGRNWEIDQFTGPLDGLVLAEIELPSQDEQIAIPSFCVREVTYETQYSNAALAQFARSLMKLGANHVLWPPPGP